VKLTIVSCVCHFQKLQNVLELVGVNSLVTIVETTELVRIPQQFSITYAARSLFFKISLFVERIFSKVAIADEPYYRVWLVHSKTPYFVGLFVV
jgi:hypothetical protein